MYERLPWQVRASLCHPATRGDQGRTFIRTADDVLITAGVAAVPGSAYRMDAALVEDPDLKWVVAANWTQAKVEPRGTRSAPLGQAAAGSMPEQP